MRGKLLKSVTRLAMMCALQASSVMLASCDYWGEDWYKNGESGTEVSATSTLVQAKNVLWAYIGFKEGGQGTGYILSDDGKTVTGHISLFVYDSSAEAESQLDWWKEYAGESATVTRSGNKIYVMMASDEAEPVAAMFTEENGLYYATDAEGLKKLDGSDGLTGKWAVEYDENKEYYVFEGNGTYRRYYNFTTTPPSYESGNWKSATGNIISLLSAEGYDTSFYEGYTGRTGTYVFTRRYENASWEPEFRYADGTLYEEGFTCLPFIKKQP